MVRAEAGAEVALACTPHAEARGTQPAFMVGTLPQVITGGTTAQAMEAQITEVQAVEYAADTVATVVAAAQVREEITTISSTPLPTTTMRERRLPHTRRTHLRQRPNRQQRPNPQPGEAAVEWCLVRKDLFIDMNRHRRRRQRIRSVTESLVAE